MQVDTPASSSSSSSTARVSPDDALPVFARGIVSLLACWPALRIAVTHNWIPKRQAADIDPSGQYAPETAAEKRTRLAEELVDAFYSSYTDPDKAGALPDGDEIEDFLVDFVEVEYGVALDDASEVQIAKDCRTLWLDCLAGRAENVDRFERMANKAREEDNDPSRAMRGTRTGEQDDEDDDSDSSGAEDTTVRGTASNPNGNGNGMDVDQPSTARQRAEPEVDEDGFTTVAKKGGRR